MTCRTSELQHVENIKYNCRYQIDTLPEPNGSPLKIDPWKRMFLLETTIFRGHVSFRDGRSFF